MNTFLTDDDKARIAGEQLTEEAIVKAARYLAYMRARGSSVALTWGEDTDSWECSWISGGSRFTGIAHHPLTAARKCYEAMVRAKGAG